MKNIMPNVFVVYDCKKRKNVLITQSARKANKSLRVGIKIEVWNENGFVEIEVADKYDIEQSIWNITDDIGATLLSYALDYAYEKISTMACSFT